MSDPITPSAPSPSAPSKKPRTRSPAYPAIDLEDATVKAAVLYGKLGRHYGPADTVVTFWGYDGDSSTGFSALSALIKFGLLEDEGSGAKRQVRLTSAGIGLVFKPDTTSDEHRSALQTAALLPSIHAELWKKYEGELPDDAVIERYLVLERGFNSAYVKGFINQFRRTLAFAGLKAGDMVADTNSEEVPMTATQSTTAPAAAPGNFPRSHGLTPKIAEVVQNQRREEPADNRREIRLPHPAGDITIKGPFPMSDGDWTTFVTVLNAFKVWLVKDEPTTSSSALPPPPEQSAFGAQG